MALPERSLVFVSLACLVLAPSCLDEAATLPTTNTLCDDCHGGGGNSAPPEDVSGNTATTFTGVGAHRSHTDASTWHAAVACDECHLVPAVPSEPGHMDTVLPAEVVWGGLALADSATPAWNGTTCSGSYCHGGTLDGGTNTTPAWTTVDGSQATCGSCHGLPPGPPHSASPLCGNCHSAVADNTPQIKPSGAALHVNGTVDVSGLTCDSCHGTPGVNDAPPADTSGNSATTFTGVGAHQAHLAPDRSAVVACDQCHGVPSDAADIGHMDTALPAELTWGALADADGVTSAWTDPTCTTYCHGASLNGGTNTSPTWTTVDGSEDTCGSCHGLPPGGAHTYSDKCGECHAAVASDSSTITTPALHINGTVQYDVSGAACNTCHGNATGNSPPFDTSGNSATTFTGVGAHRSHLGTLITTSVSCATCHTVPATVTAGGHIDATPGAETNFTGLASSTIWNGTTCSNTYCHNSATPTWTNVSGSALPCDSCHGAPPGGTHTTDNQCQTCHASVVSAPTTISDPTLHINGTVQHDISGAACNTCHGGANQAPPTDLLGGSSTGDKGVGAHQAHLGSGMSSPVACTECHVAVVTGIEPAHIDGDDTAEVTFGTLATDSGALTPLWDGATTCSNTYCHGATLDGGTTTTPVWTMVDGSQKECDDCHGDPPGGTHSASTDCSACHGAVVNANDTTFADATLHVNGTVEYTVTCNSCHGSGANDAPPVDTSGGSSTLATGVGAHQAHLSPDRSAVVACTECHVVPAAPGDPGHTDTALPAELTWGALADADGVTSAWTDPTCTTYCHGASLNGGTNTSPTWTTVDGSEDTCGSCHGLPPGGAHVTSPYCGNCHAPVADSTPVITTAANHVDGTVDSQIACDACHGSATNVAPPSDLDGTPSARGVGAHQAHLTSTALRSPAMACTECHVVPAARDDAGHIDSDMPAEVDFSASALGSGTVWTAATTSCSNTYCHGDTLDGGSATAPDWTIVNGSQKQCDSCHGTPPGGLHPTDNQCQTCHASVVSAPTTISDPTLHINGSVELELSGAACNACHGGANEAPPTDLLGGSNTGDKGVGAHQAHLGSGMSSPVACTECHVAVVTGIEPAHIDGDDTAEVTFGTLATDSGALTPLWDGATTCSNTYCHGATLDGGTTTTPVWTTVDGSQKQCNSCHGNPPGGTHSASTVCSACHGTVVNADNVTFANKTLHVNGTVEYTLTCTSCHGTDGVSNAPPVDTSGNSATTFSGVGAHQTHLNPVTAISAPIDCDACHVAVLPTDFTHSDGMIDMNPAAGWNSGSGTCSSSYCHDGARDGTTPTPTWTFAASAAPLPCNSCHGNPPTTGGHSASGDCSLCHGEVVNDNDTTFKDASLHIDGTVQGGESGGGLDCGACHTGIWERLNDTTGTNFGGQPIVSRHTIGNVSGTNDSDVQNNPDATWGSPLSNVAVADRSCTNMCHNDHPHGAGLHTESVHEDATDSTSRAGAATSTDFNGAATNGGMCVSCHRNPINSGGATIDKAAYDASAHDYITNAYGDWTYTQHDGAVFNRNCTKCHADSGDAQQDNTTPFGAAHFSDYPSLLSGSTNPNGSPGVFICYNCHGNGSTGTDRSGKDIATDMAKANAHPVDADSTHDPAAELTVAHSDDVYAGAKRHANCLDCHNPHAAQPGVHNYSATATSTRNNITGPLTNVSGVSVDYTGLANFEAPADTDYTWIPASTGATKEYQICFKCHTTFAATGGGGPPPVPVGMLYLTNNTITITNEPTDHTMSVAFTAPQGGSDPWVLRSMEPANGAADFRQDVYISTSTGVRYYRGRTWVSPELADQDMPAQNWTILIPARERDAGANAYLYLKIWVWEPGGGQRGLLFDEAVVNGEFQTSFAYPDVTATVGGAAVNGVLEGDRLIVEAAYYTDSTGGLVDYRVHLRYGDAGYDAYIDPANDILLKGVASGPPDLAQEFSPMNRSAHPIVTGLDNYPNSPAPTALNTSQMKAPWNVNVGQQTMMCSDCHNTDAASSAAQGPHGSAAQFMLRGSNTANWPNHTLSNFSTSWCANCHNKGSNQGHTYGDHQSYPCYRCHIVIPHGGKLSRLMADNDTMPARYAFGGTLNTNYLQEFAKDTEGGYQDVNCRAQCAGNHDGETPGENW